MKVTIVENKLEGLNKILEDKKPHEFGIMLSGGVVYSRKTIKLTNENKYKTTNHIDDTHHTLTAKEIMDKSITNIGDALTKRALFIMPE